MRIDSFLSSFLGELPEWVKMDFAFPELSQYIPTQIDFMSMLKFLVIFSATFLLLGTLSRVVMGKRSGANHALSAVMGILFIYVLTVMIYTFRPLNIHSYLSPLPFVVLAGEYISFFSFFSAQYSVICYELLAMLILAFLVNLLDTFMPEGESVIAWFFLRVITVLLAMAAHLLVRWAIQNYLPNVLVNYAPMILLGTLAVMLLLGILNLLLGLVVAAVNPVLGAICTFFFSNIVGKQLTKAAVTTAAIAAIILVLEYFGVFLLSITASALIACIPLIAVLLILWYVIGRIL